MTNENYLGFGGKQFMSMCRIMSMYIEKCILVVLHKILT